MLSGGERSRLLLCQILVQQANLLLLDEPTNHLDIQGRRVLEKALKIYGGTVCLVSHDRHLINAVANKIMVISTDGAEVFPGNYDDYQKIWKKRLDSPEPLPKKESPQYEIAPLSRKTKKQKRLEANRRNELSRQKAPLTDRLVKLEEAIELSTSRLDELTRLLAQPDTYEDGASVVELNREYVELKRTLEDQTRQWEETAIELEALEESFWAEKRMDQR